MGRACKDKNLQRFKMAKMKYESMGLGCSDNRVNNS